MYARPMAFAGGANPRACPRDHEVDMMDPQVFDIALAMLRSQHPRSPYLQGRDVNCWMYLYMTGYLDKAKEFIAATEAT